jgi:hypothetical protein
MLTRSLRAKEAHRERSMETKKWREILSNELVRAERELADFRSVVVKQGLRVVHRDLSGERDVTAQELRSLENAVDKYRRVLRDS